MHWIQQPNNYTLKHAGFVAGIDKQTCQWMVSEVTFDDADRAVLRPRWWGTAVNLEQAKSCVEALVS